METIKLTVRIGNDGILKLETPTQFKDTDTEVVLVLQPKHELAVDDRGYPLNFFEELDAIRADDLKERPDQSAFQR